MKPSVGKVIMTVGTTVVAVSIIAGVILVGSPAEGRREQLDSTRVEDLKRIMSATDSFWERNARLPEKYFPLAEKYFRWLRGERAEATVQETSD